MQPDLWGKTPDWRSIEIIRDFAPNDKPYYLAFSGGKDSVVLHDLAVRSGVRFEAHYHVTTVDPPELIYFMRQHHPDLIWDRPKKSMYARIPERILPTRNRRWCCQEYKEAHGHNVTILTGVRSAESPRRKKRGLIEPCPRKHSHFVHAIKFWTDADVWTYIRERSLPYCSLYDEGWKRLGCVICPFERNVARSMARWPGIWKATRRAAGKLYEAKKDQYGKRWPSAEAMWQWWIARDGAWKQADDDCPLFGSGMEMR